MNDGSLSQAPATAARPSGGKITAEGPQRQLLHVTLGYTVLGLIGFRLVWGAVGTRYARFSSFVRGPSALVRYLGSIMRGQPQHYTGHNPAGAIAILALLLLGLATGISGWATYTVAAGEAYEEVHEVLATLTLLVVALHIVGAIVGSWVHHENLVAAMLTGRKRGNAPDGIEHDRRGLGVLLLAAVLGFWWWQLQHPTDGLARTGRTTESETGSHVDED